MERNAASRRRAPRSCLSLADRVFTVLLLIGFEVHFQALLDSWQVILVAYVVVTANQGAGHLRRCCTGLGNGFPGRGA